MRLINARCTSESSPSSLNARVARQAGENALSLFLMRSYSASLIGVAPDAAEHFPIRLYRKVRYFFRVARGDITDQALGSGALRGGLPSVCIQPSHQGLGNRLLGLIDRGRRDHRRRRGPLFGVVGVRLEFVRPPLRLPLGNLAGSGSPTRTAYRSLLALGCKMVIVVGSVWLTARGANRLPFTHARVLRFPESMGARLPAR